MMEKSGHQGRAIMSMRKFRKKKMQVKFFFIPRFYPENAERELNLLLRSKRVLKMESLFAEDDKGWDIMVTRSAEFGIV